MKKEGLHLGDMYLKKGKTYSIVNSFYEDGEGFSKEDLARHGLILAYDHEDDGFLLHYEGRPIAFLNNFWKHDLCAINRPYPLLESLAREIKEYGAPIDERFERLRTILTIFALSRHHDLNKYDSFAEHVKDALMENEAFFYHEHLQDATFNTFKKVSVRSKTFCASCGIDVSRKPFLECKDDFDNEFLFCLSCSQRVLTMMHHPYLHSGKHPLIKVEFSENDPIRPEGGKFDVLRIIGRPSLKELFRRSKEKREEKNDRNQTA